MRCIFWNIRGIANDKTQNRLSKLINKWDPDIVGIAEPMINPRDISSAYLQSLGMSASFYSNDRQNSAPNIWLLWKSTVSTPTLLQQSSQQITVEVEGCLITVVHAHCIYVQRRHLWNEIKQISSFNLPWLVLGDFNAYLSILEKCGGNRPTAAALNDFRDCISESQLMEIPNTGFVYTWWNKQVGRFKIMGKLGRMLCNAEWCSKFQGWNYKVGSRICSDHSPILGSWRPMFQGPETCLSKFSICGAPILISRHCESKLGNSHLGHSIFIRLGLKRPRLL
ncbi:hypothetical protein IFM89_035624 [Coptis chinensis]|uniref:Endonuclease/exonuclease/phosphatase domain-containing protein n=1 Tax=Coptis chinensis TaxID=261450 RepID=A0A835HRQ4_9MAGN|nr:hypothetical protein IFM89_035624 [Coptis chinensis]